MTPPTEQGKTSFCFLGSNLSGLTQGSQKSLNLKVGSWWGQITPLTVHTCDVQTNGKLT